MDASPPVTLPALVPIAAPTIHDLSELTIPFPRFGYPFTLSTASLITTSATPPSFANTKKSHSHSLP
ncbi:unnamed protein product [Linum trigynum]|uniref:Uncharacterized protein n=1 Tax=Linum trigynum TaxID=586398 RepID=A0AAV2FX56_9ROSI